MKLNNLAAPSRDEEASVAEQLFFLAAPLLIVFTGSQQLEEGFDFDGIPDLAENEPPSAPSAALSSTSRDATFYVTKKLVLLTAPTMAGLLESRSMLRTSPELAKTLVLRLLNIHAMARANCRSSSNIYPRRAPSSRASSGKPSAIASSTAMRVSTTTLTSCCCACWAAASAWKRCCLFGTKASLRPSTP